MTETDDLGAAVPFRVEHEGRWYRAESEVRWLHWAKRFGFKPEYEPHGLKLSDGTGYRPDFYLRRLDAWLEVKWRKPNGEAFRRCRQLARDTGKTVLLAYGAPTLDRALWAFAWCDRLHANRWEGPLSLQRFDPLHGLWLVNGHAEVLARIDGGLLGFAAVSDPQPADAAMRAAVLDALNLPLMPKDRKPLKLVG
jgi:hypothetical protein